MDISHYHERQHLSHCLKHTLNNLFQQPLFTARDLDVICKQLSPQSLPFLNPHRTPFLGNYDVNVLELALQQQGKELCWHDLRDTEFAKLPLGECWGIVVNVKSTGPLTWLFPGRHWFALKQLDGRWYSLDSHLPTPQPVPCRRFAARQHFREGEQQGEEAEEEGSPTAVRHFLQQQVREHDAKVFVVKDATDAAGGAAVHQ